MKIAILSGKGGTGKTLLSINLATVMASKVGTTYIDCDVEEPNGRIFLKPQNVKEIQVGVKIPSIDKTKCTACRKCVDFCKFNALAMIKDSVLVFDEVCHACGGCSLVCESGAVSEKERIVGHIEVGNAQLSSIYSSKSVHLTAMTGIMKTGEVSGIPIIRKLLRNVKNEKNVIIDCPPGCACVVMESIKDADYCLLVAEPTIFGAHNLEMVYQLVTMFNKKFGVALNKVIDGDNPSKDFCERHNIDIVGSIPFDKDIALLNSNGKIISLENELYASYFNNILTNIKNKIGGEE